MAQAEDSMKRLVVSWHRRQGLEIRVCRDFCGWRLDATANAGRVSFPIAVDANLAEAWLTAAEEVAYACGKSVAEMLVSEDLNAAGAEENSNGD